MNLKSNILKISVVIALIFMLVPVIAAEDVDDSVIEAADDSINAEVDDSVTEAVDDSINTEYENDELAESLDDSLAENLDDDPVEATSDEGNENQDATDDVLQEAVSADYAGGYGPGEESADLEVSVITPTKKVHAGDITGFGLFVKNNGPDTAYNVIVRAALISGSINILAGIPSKGYYEIYKGIIYWYVGDLAPGENATLALAGPALSEDDIIVLATVTSDTLDPDLSNNIAIGVIDVVTEEVAEAGVEMHATGNPIVLALLALLSVAGLSLRRRY